MKIYKSSSVSSAVLTTRKVEIGGISLVIGAVAFLFFWFSASTPNNVIIQWPLPLLVHGMSIVLISAGLILITSNLNKKHAGFWMTKTGATLTIVGLFTVFPLIPLGLGILAAGLIIAKRSRIGSFFTIMGSVILLATVLFGARVGMEDAPELSNILRVAFQIGVILIATGLIVIGSGEMRRTHHKSK